MCTCAMVHGFVSVGMTQEKQAWRGRVAAYLPYPHRDQGYAFTTAFMNIWVNVNDLQAVRSFIHHSLSLVETRPRLFDFIHRHSRSS